MVIKYTMTILRYTIFCNIGCVKREISIELISAKIKYTIFRFGMDTGNIKFVKIYKVD